MSNKHSFAVAPDEAGLRLDQVIPRHVAGLSRRKARAVIDLGGVFVDRARVKVAGRTVRAGQRIEVTIGGAFDRAAEAKRDARDEATRGQSRDDVARAQSREPKIVHEDAHVIVVDKPAGLVTAPTPESDRGDLLDLLKRRYGEVYLVHRIDLPTSGLLVFARTREANKRLGDAFKLHDVDREYRAVAVGDVAEQTIDRPIQGRPAITHVRPVPLAAGVRPLSGATLLDVRLETGRTHQIRIHLAGIGRPVAGDRTHGGETERVFSLQHRPPRLALHARVLGFVHPATGERVRFESEMPDDLARWIESLR